MVYYLVRIIILVLLFSIVTFYKYRKKNITKGSILQSLWIIVVACIISFQIPLEYFFLRYYSVEKAFAYAHNPSTLIKVIEKDDIAVGLYTQDDKSISFYPMYKEEGGWKIDPIKTFYTPHKSYNSNLIYDFTFPNQSSTMIFILNSSFHFNTPKISDSYNSEFSLISFQLNNNNYLIYYTIAPEVDENYIITVNSDSFTLK